MTTTNTVIATNTANTKTTEEAAAIVGIGTKAILQRFRRAGLRPVLVMPHADARRRTWYWDDEQIAAITVDRRHQNKGRPCKY